jgi:hypothetical protein
VTIPSPPSYQGDAPFSAVSATRPHHRAAERKKFRGGSIPSNSSIVQSLVDQNMLLLPATATHFAAAAPAVGTEPPTTPAPHASGLSNSLAFTSLVHMLATFTLVALASLPPLRTIPNPGYGSLLRYMLVAAVSRPRNKPYYSSITY